MCSILVDVPSEFDEIAYFAVGYTLLYGIQLLDTHYFTQYYWT